MSDILLVYDSAAGNGYDPLETLREAGHSVDGLNFKGWVNINFSLDHGMAKIINGVCLERITKVIEDNRYDLMIIDGVMADYLMVGYNVIGEGLENVPIMVAVPVFPSDIDLHGSGCEFGWDGNGDIERLVEVLLEDPVRREGLGGTLYFNPDEYYEKDGLILPKD